MLPLKNGQLKLQINGNSYAINRHKRVIFRTSEGPMVIRMTTVFCIVLYNIISYNSRARTGFAQILYFLSLLNMKIIQNTNIQIPLWISKLGLIMSK